MPRPAACFAATHQLQFRHHRVILIGGALRFASCETATALELASELGLPVIETRLQAYDLYTADEVFFTSTPYCIMPATKFNGLPVGNGRVGSMTQRLLGAWSKLVGLDIVAQARTQLIRSEP